MNYAGKVSMVMPFAAALASIMTAVISHAHVLALVLSAFGGFVVGFCAGALAIGFATLLLSFSCRYKNAFCVLSFGAAYFILPILFLAAACLATVFGLRSIL